MDVKLVVGMLSPLEDNFIRAEEILCRHFGGIDFGSAIIPFKHTTYYEKEMGQNILRKFISFKQLIDDVSIWEAKITTSCIEKELSDRSGKRSINIDPGYVSRAKFVLTTRKNYDHRIALKQGIYAEVTLHFRNGTFRPWEWTYPDYKTREYIDIFNKIRMLYVKQLKQQN